MVYAPDYYEEDLSEIVIDIIVKGLVTFGIFATLVVLVLVIKWVRKRGV